MKKKDLMPTRVKRAKKELEIISHTKIRQRDSINDYEIKGYCFDCGLLVEGCQFQAGHFQPSGSCGAWLRYHPHNMHGQAGGCNCGYQQEKVKINYTLAMVRKYGEDYVMKLCFARNKSIKADIIFYETLIELYERDTWEQDVVNYLNTL